MWLWYSRLQFKHCKRKLASTKNWVVFSPNSLQILYMLRQRSIIRAASAHSSGKEKGQAKGVGKGKINLDDLPRAPNAVVPNRNALVGRSDGVPIRRNPNVDFRLTERPVRVDPAPSRRDAPRNNQYYDCNGQSYNAQYRDWMDEAWVGHHPDPQAGYRDQEENEGAWDDWHPRENVRGRSGTWP